MTAARSGLDGASMRIGRGEFVFLVGPTGCGKSTCIRLLLMELEASRGEILIAGRELSGMPRSRVPYLRRNLGVVFQDYKLLPNRTVEDNVAYALEVIGDTRQEVGRKVPDILRLVGLSTKLHSYPDELSGGEQQRVSIARAFVNHPPLLLADEPTGNLDPETSIGIMQLIYRINRTGTTVDRGHPRPARWWTRCVVAWSSCKRDAWCATRSRASTARTNPRASSPCACAERWGWGPKGTRTRHAGRVLLQARPSGASAVTPHRAWPR